MQLLQLGKFDLHKWRSNTKEILCKDNSIKSTTEPLNIEPDCNSKALGIVWNSLSDNLQFEYNHDFSTKITKRVVLAELAQLFDPLGLLNPITVLGKIFMQELWLLKLDWDESLPFHLNEQWKKYREELKIIENIMFPRSLISSDNIKNVELNGFADASNRAYDCVIYTRVQIHCHV